MFKYGIEHSTWVIENHSKYMSYDDIAKDFNATFGLSKSRCAIQQFVTKKVGVYLDTPRKAMHYTKEEEDWLIENYDKFNDSVELTKALNKVFSTNRKKDSVVEKCNKQLGIRLGNPTVFKSGHVQEQLPIGTVRKASSGYMYVKVKDSSYAYQSGYREPYWLPLQKKVWEDHFGKVSEDKMIVFLDGNIQNIDISNLYCIDRKISAVMASNRWYSKNAEFTLTAIKWCELYYALKNS